MWFRWNLPDWLYEALPYLYVAFGLVVILALGNGMAVFGGLMLIAAGAVAAFKRVTNRGRPRGRPRPANEGSVPGAAVERDKLVWRNEYASGHPVIDAQHHRLFAIGNLLLDAVRTNQPKPEVERLLHQLVGEFDNHFRTEESILETTDRGFANAHKQVHQELRQKASTLLTPYFEGKVGIDVVISFLTYELVASHIAEEVVNVRFGRDRSVG
jgi:hemerythrin-like metal-binding protein